MKTYRHTPGEHFEQNVAREGPRQMNGSAASGSLHIRTGDKFAAEYQPLEYAIDQILPKSTLITATGPGNVGKTALGIMIAAHKANGRDLGDREVPLGHVLYASAENTVDFRHRYIAMRDNWAGFDERRFHVLTANERNGLTTSADKIEQHAHKLEITFDLVIVDTQAAWSPVEDEANNTEQLNYARALRRLCLLPGSPAVMVLSHPVKTPTKASECRPRGGVAFENETDANWTLWPVNADDPGIVEVGYTRLRTPRWEPFCFALREIETTSVVDVKGRPLTSVRADLVDGDEAKAARARTKPIRKTKAELAHDVLATTLVEHPELAPDPRRYPTDRALTLTKRFRERLAMSGVIDPGGDERGQWRDVKNAMLKKGILRIEGSLCWSPV